MCTCHRRRRYDATGARPYDTLPPPRPAVDTPIDMSTRYFGPANRKEVVVRVVRATCGGTVRDVARGGIGGVGALIRLATTSLTQTAPPLSEAPHVRYTYGRYARYARLTSSAALHGCGTTWVTRIVARNATWLGYLLVLACCCIALVSDNAPFDANPNTVSLHY